MFENEKCEDCGDLITYGEFSYSMNQFMRPLCQPCQVLERERKYPKKLASFLNTELGKRHIKASE